MSGGKRRRKSEENALGEWVRRRREGREGREGRGVKKDGKGGGGEGALVPRSNLRGKADGGGAVKSGGGVGSGGMFSGLGFFVLMAVLAGFFVAVTIEMQMPSDLSTVEGRRVARGGERYEADAFVRAVDGVRAGEELRITEELANRWMAQVVGVRQGGMLGESQRPVAVWVEFHEGECEVIVERATERGTHATSLCFALEMDAEEVRVDVTGGRVGGLRVPGAVAKLGMGSWRRLYGVLEAEVEALMRHRVVRFEEGVMVVGRDGG